MEIKINDSAFAHTDFSTLQKSKYMNWVRTNDVRDVCFFTDNSLTNAVQSHDKIKIAWIIEPKAINSYSYDFVRENHNLFDYILTYDTELLSISDKFKFYPHGGCWLSDLDKQLFDKTKFCSIIASNKRQTIGHKLRHDVISQLSSVIDVYGHAGNNNIDNKINGLKDYKFSIVIENSQQDDYFTEKLIDTLLTGTIPLYWGTANINNYFKNIPIFNTIDELKRLLEYYSNNEYSKNDIKDNFETALKYTIPEDYIIENYPTIIK